MDRQRGYFGKVWLLVFLVGAVFSRAGAQSEGEDFRSIRAARISQPPEIDGVLDDSCWRSADWQGEFRQLKPVPGDPARARTLAAVAFDDGYLYAAFRCFNPTGPSANSKITRRDGDMDQDNAVTLYLDTFHTRRDCYYFSTNSRGTQIDGRIGEDGGTNDKSWDCTWSVAVKEDSLGWTAEFAIPVAEMRIPRTENPVWGINFRRNYPEFYETSFWRKRDVAWRISQSGDLLGLERFRKLFSAALYPYVVGLNANTPSAGRKTVYSSGDNDVISGADLRLKMGNAVDGNVTFNPDFATVEADLEIINLTRYETAFPEKRLFFLEGAELFNNPIDVFYSRRIGDLDWGVKGNGRAGRFNWALLSADERSTGGHPSSQTTAVRLQRDAFGSSNIGLTAVDRSWSGGFSRAVSADGAVVFNPRVKLNGQFVGSFPSGGDEFTKACFLRLTRDTGLNNMRLSYTNLDPGFRKNVNQVGFIQDDDRHDLETWYGGEHWVNKYGIDKVSFNEGNNLSWRHSGALRMVHAGGWVGVTFLENWLVGLGTNYNTELFEKRFRNPVHLVEGVWNPQKWNNANFLHQWGRNFDRDYYRFRIRGNFKPTPETSLSLGYTRLRFSPDPTDQGTNLYDLSCDYNFTPNLWFRLVTQYNTRNHRTYVYGLFGWRFVPPFGALYLAYTGDRFDVLGDQPPPLVRKNERAFFLKLTVPLTIY
ncbi:MAG: DUF5916 domain-containing protein [Candidatus Glassbacteria bacterium]